MADAEILTLERLIDIQKKLGLNPLEAAKAFERACEFHGTDAFYNFDTFEYVNSFCAEHTVLPFDRSLR